MFDWLANEKVIIGVASFFGGAAMSYGVTRLLTRDIREEAETAKQQLAEMNKSATEQTTA